MSTTTARRAIGERSSLSDGAGGRSLRRLLVRGGMTLGVAVGLERGCNFLANLLAARAAGPEVFGAYAILLTTAGMVATYAGAGIGATANRFAGQYPRESREYRRLLHALVLVSVGSAALAAGVMFWGAGPLARLLLRNENLTFFIKLAAVSAGAMILLECCRGLLIGQQKFLASLILSIISGVGLLLVLPNVAPAGAAAMVVGQGCVALCAVAVCVLLARRLGITPLPSNDIRTASTPGPGVRQVFTFGLYQLGAVVGLNIAGWWIMSLVARADGTLMQMGIYAVANQFRQLINIFPDLLARLCYPLLTKERSREYGGSNHVMLVNAFVITTISLVAAGFVIAVLPWLLRYAYGAPYLAGEMPCALLVATAVVHMGGAPAANRLNVVALRATGVMNAIWTVLLISLGTVFVPMGGATGAAGLFLITHIISAVLTLVVLNRYEALPRGLIKVSAIGMVGAVGFCGLAFARSIEPSYKSVLTIALALLLPLLLFALGRFGQSEGWLPRTISVSSFLPRII